MRAAPWGYRTGVPACCFRGSFFHLDVPEFLAQGFSPKPLRPLSSGDTVKLFRSFRPDL
jgi:hypothetical protein